MKSDWRQIRPISMEEFKAFVYDAGTMQKKNFVVSEVNENADGKKVKWIGRCGTDKRKL